MIEQLDRLLGAPVRMRSLAVVRILVGLIAAWHLYPVMRDALQGHSYQDSFYHPYTSWYPELPGAAYVAVLVIGFAAAFAMSAGILSGVTTKLTFGVVAYNLFLSTTHFHNNRAYLVIVLAVLAIAPCGRELSVDAWLRARRGFGEAIRPAPGWPLWLLRFECATVYAASGTSKLLDPDWFNGTVTWGRLIEQEAAVRASVLPGWVADLVLERSFHTFAAKLVIATELFIASGLWWRRTRPFAVFVAVVFHVMIQFTADVETFSILGIAVLFAWADPAMPWLQPGRWRPGRKKHANTPLTAGTGTPRG
ncbi:MAG: HTTM domain-containing protein [Dehalococcoidia bacterium]|nr:HTTM domain-containing protein [Dehalococcoidia bacterium]